MNLTELLSAIEFLQSEGATVLLKWDGQRQASPCTVVVTGPDAGDVFREDSDDIWASLARAVADYRSRHA